MNKNKQGIEVKPGQVWRDMDKRMVRHVMVIAVDGGKATVRNCNSAGVDCGWGRSSTISISRMHPHATGYALVKPAEGDASFS